MPELPKVSSDKAIRAFSKDGFVHVRTKGSHYIMKKPDWPSLLSIPLGRRELAKGTLRSLIRTAGMSVERFIQLLD